MSARSTTAFAITALLFVASGCDEEAPEVPTTTTEEPGEQTPEPEPTSDSEERGDDARPRLGTTRERCALEGDRTIRPTVPPGRTATGHVAVAAYREAHTALVAIDATEARDQVELAWPHAESETETFGAFLPGLEAGSLFALEMTGPDTALLVRTSACVHEERASQCLYARVVRVDRSSGEHGVSEPTTIVMPSVPSTMRVTATDGRVLVGRSHVAASPMLDTFYVDDATRTLRHVSRTLGEGLDLERGPVEILALAATGGSHAVLFRQGAQEASDSSVTLSTGLDEHAVPELREALVIESVAIFAGAIVMVAAFEFSEPSWLRMGLDGEMLGEPRPLAAGEAVPIPFADRRVARIDGTPPRTIEIRDGAGHATAPLVSLPSAVRSADLARFDGGFLVATLSEDTNVRVSTLRCRDSAPAAVAPSSPSIAAPIDDNASASQ